MRVGYYLPAITMTLLAFLTTSPTLCKPASISKGSSPNPWEGGRDGMEERVREVDGIGRRIVIFGRLGGKDEGWKR